MKKGGNCTKLYKETFFGLFFHFLIVRVYKTIQEEDAIILFDKIIQNTDNIVQKLYAMFCYNTLAGGYSP